MDPNEYGNSFVKPSFQNAASHNTQPYFHCRFFSRWFLNVLNCSLLSIFLPSTPSEIRHHIFWGLILYVPCTWIYIQVSQSWFMSSIIALLLLFLLLRKKYYIHNILPLGSLMIPIPYLHMWDPCQVTHLVKIILSNNILLPFCPLVSTYSVVYTSYRW